MVFFFFKLLLTPGSLVNYWDVYSWQSDCPVAPLLRLGVISICWGPFVPMEALTWVNMSHLRGLQQSPEMQALDASLSTTAAVAGHP